MDIYRTGSKVNLNVWEEKKRAFIELTPAVAGAKGQPKAGEQRFDYEKSIRISFRLLDMYQAAYKFVGLAHGAEIELSKFADKSKNKASESDAKVKLTAKLNDNEQVAIFMSEGDKKCNITLEADEAYAIGKWFEVHANRFAVLEAKEDTARRAAASNG